MPPLPPSLAALDAPSPAKADQLPMGDPAAQHHLVCLEYAAPRPAAFDLFLRALMASDDDRRQNISVPTTPVISYPHG
ncbi:hypothetical protein K438DRAFT_2028452 [Mycena galopus ATCC 62051]|nr:hypothetical protein K438DRAFT_2028452 [Mycena galopus ATCC 62051]